MRQVVRTEFKNTTYCVGCRSKAGHPYYGASRSKTAFFLISDRRL